MNRCQHGQKITKFCITEHCHHKEAAGCDYCIRKYHFHLTSTVLLSEDDVTSLLKNLTIPIDIKYKAKNLQQAAFDYLKHIKYSFNNWIDLAMNSIADGLSNATIYRKGFLNTYNRLKQRQYRKINANQLRSMSQYAKSVTLDSLKKQEISRYYEQVESTMKLAASLQKVALEISKLPEIREGQKKIHQHSRAKLDQIYQLIRRQKEKRDRLQKIQINHGERAQTLEQNPMLKQAESFQKVDNHHSQGSTSSKEALEKKPQNIVYEETQKRPNQSQPQEEVKQPTNGKQTTEEKRKRLRRRKSSIDDKIDLKFAAIVQEKARAFKQTQEMKKKLEEKADQQSKVSKEISQHSNSNDHNKTIPQKQQFKQISLITDLLNSKLSGKGSEANQQQEQTTASKSQHKKITQYLQTTPKAQRQKSEVSSNKASQSSFRGIMEILIDNILPPLPPTPKSHTQQPIFQKIIKIPVVNQAADQILSPIYKTKKRQDEKKSQKGHLGFVLIPTIDKVEQKIDKVIEKQIETLFPIAQTSPQEEGSETAIAKKNSSEVQHSQRERSPDKDSVKSEDLIYLQKNQKNSLLLFSQALKSSADRAIQLLKAALKYSPENLSAAEYLSYLYIESEKAKQCLQVCQSILIHIKDTPQEFDLTLHLHNNKASALNLLGRYSESIMILENCLKYRKKPYFYKNLGDAYFSLGIAQKAAMNYESAIILDPHYDQAFYNLSATEFIQQQYKSAQLNIGKALELQPLNEIYMELSKQIERRLECLAIQ